MAWRARREEPPFPYLEEGDSFRFPDPRSAGRRGVVCSGGNLSPGLLLSAYSQGLFPWFSEDEPILWWSPDPRFVLFPDKVHVSATMRKVLRRRRFDLCLDRDFRAVITACSSAERPGQDGTWITGDMIEAYCRLHELGLAHSAEAYEGGRLVGGLYGVSLGSIFFGESMFSREDDASKAVFLPLALRLRDEGFSLIDSQVYTDHLAGMGAEEVPRDYYLGLLAAGLQAPTRRGSWAEAFPGFPESSGYRRIIPSTEEPKRP